MVINSRKWRKGFGREFDVLVSSPELIRLCSTTTTRLALLQVAFERDPRLSIVCGVANAWWTAASSRAGVHPSLLLVPQEATCY